MHYDGCCHPNLQLAQYGACVTGVRDESGDWPAGFGVERCGWHYWCVCVCAHPLPIGRLLQVIITPRSLVLLSHDLIDLHDFVWGAVKRRACGRQKTAPSSSSPKEEEGRHSHTFAGEKSAFFFKKEKKREGWLALLILHTIGASPHLPPSSLSN